ncbi:MAG: hypothetical protein NWE78_03845 [Candidatus Bathyarchaeota archaeon]|nr:hypothetical protein [Candidatus Bathyarchaeota archaeon]
MLIVKTHFGGLFFYLSSNRLVETFIEEFLTFSKPTEAVELKWKKRGLARDISTWEGSNPSDPTTINQGRLLPFMKAK